MRRCALLLLPLALAACGDDGRDAVCGAVDANRAQWLRAERIADPAERERALSAAAAEGRARLAKAVDAGRIAGWKVDVMAVTAGLPRLGMVKFALPCAATLIAPELNAEPTAFGPAAALKPGDSATIDGGFARSLDGALPFLELSVTDRGLMTDPEFVIRLEKLRR